MGDGTTGDGGAELLLLLKFDSVGERVADVGVGERFGALGALVMERLGFQASQNWRKFRIRRMRNAQE